MKIFAKNDLDGKQSMRTLKPGIKDKKKIKEYGRSPIKVNIQRNDRNSERRQKKNITRKATTISIGRKENIKSVLSAKVVKGSRSQNFFKRDEPTLWRICIHEAGHAVISHVLGIHAVAIEASAKFAATSYDLGMVPFIGSDYDFLESSVISHMAGGVAELILELHKPLRFDRQKMGDGWEINQSLKALHLQPKYRYVFRAMFLRKCKELVAYHSSVIRDLAETIEKCGGIHDPVVIYTWIEKSMAQNRCTRFQQPKRIKVDGKTHQINI